MTAFRSFGREWGVVAAIGVLTVGIIVLFMLLIPALGRISQQATAGEQAKRRQCVTLSIALKVFADAHRRHVITQRDLDRFRATRPRNCDALK